MMRMVISSQGKSLLTSELQTGTYVIGVQSKTQPKTVAKTTTLTILNRETFQLTDLKGNSTDPSYNNTSGYDLSNSVDYRVGSDTIYAPVTNFGYYLEKERQGCDDPKCNL